MRDEMRKILTSNLTIKEIISCGIFLSSVDSMIRKSHRLNWVYYSALKNLGFPDIEHTSVYDEVSYTLLLKGGE